MEFLAALFAVIGYLQKLAEQAAFAAVRASAKKATPHRLGKRDRFFRPGHGGIP
jgi:hypothetical protein